MGGAGRLAIRKMDHGHGGSFDSVLVVVSRPGRYCLIERIGRGLLTPPTLVVMAVLENDRTGEWM